MDPKYPYRYLSSYPIDYRIDQNGNSYKFLGYDSNHRYEGNFEYRRRDLNNYLLIYFH
ncbi:MAG: hypothetical protein KBT58_11620 [Bizionia sp.]|nr:hypothetical protein [Bizionia sp.]